MTGTCDVVINGFGPCLEAAVHCVHVGCVHEHVRLRGWCVQCFESVRSGEVLVCTPCRAAGYEVPLVILAARKAQP